MMELVGKTDRLNKISFPQSKKRRLYSGFSSEHINILPFTIKKEKAERRYYNA